jgi:hypothetical protein
MALYVTRARLVVEGREITDFKSVTEKSRVMRKQVPLMYQSGTADITQRFGVEVEYVVPKINPFNFDLVAGGASTLDIEYDSGVTVRYGGVATAEVGDATLDGENELTQKVTFIAETRNGATGA